MRVYFLSEKPCYLKAAGLPVGTVDGFERTAELDPADNVLLEFLCPGHHPVVCTFSEQFLFSPPEDIRLYFTKRGVAVYVAAFRPVDTALRPLAQERIGDILCTLYRQGGVQLSVQTGEGFQIVDLGDEFAGAKIYPAGDDILLEAPSAFCILDRNGTVLTKSEGTVSERGRIVTADIPFHDSLGHIARCSYEGGKLTACSILTSESPTAATYALALFETVLIGGDVLPFLAENLLEKASALGEYLGPFRSVVLGNRPEEVGLVYEVRPRVFEVRYFCVTLEEDGKISNIRPAEGIG